MSGTGLAERSEWLFGALLRRTPIVRRFFAPSTDYRILDREEAIVAQQESGGWLEGLTARRQQDAYGALLAEMRNGAPRIDLAVSAQAIRASGVPEPAILEVGCGGGYYAEVLETLLEGGIDYTGIDFSPAMIETARAAYPKHDFSVGDATALAFQDGAFDIVFNGVSLMHVLNYAQAIAESRRVARTHCVYHSVPVFANRATTYLRKYAYGAPVVEVIFNRDELLGLFAASGLDLVETWRTIEYDVHPVTPEHSWCETFLLRVSG